MCVYDHNLKPECIAKYSKNNIDRLEPGEQTFSGGGGGEGLGGRDVEKTEDEMDRANE